MSQELDVLIASEMVGRLHENSGVWPFEYDADWLANGYPLAPGLPLQTGLISDTGSARPVQWFFDNLLPEEMARTRLVNQGASWPDVELSFPLGNATAFRQLCREHLLQFAEALGLPQSVALRELNRLVSGVAHAADKIMLEFESKNVPNAMRGGQLRMLRAIRHLPVSSMQKQLV